MAEPNVSPAVLPQVTAPAAPVPWRQILRVAWMSIVLGLLLELVLVLYALSLGQAGRPQPFIADLVHKISWGFIVCLGVAFGVTASKAPEAKAGLLGLLGVAATLGGVSPFLIGGLKGLQYGLFGALLAWLGQQTWGRLGAHIAAGVAFGLTFGMTILLVTEVAAPAPTPPVGLLSRALNELIFPAGCAVVVYASSVLGKRVPR